MKKQKEVLSALEQAVEFIKKDLDSRKYRIGYKYLTERELCEKLKLSRSTVREALRVVQVMGYLDLRPGKGAFVRSPTIEGPARWIADAKENLADLAEVRLALEPTGAKISAKRITEDGLISVLGAMALFEHACAQEKALMMAEADRRFHEAVAEASRNSTLITLCKTLNDHFTECRTALFAIPQNGTAAVKEHRAIAEALTAHEAEAAFAAMSAHLENVRQNIMEIAGDQQ